MICDLCNQRSDKIIRAASWQVCQWCVSNKVLEHALHVEFNIEKLRKAVDKAGSAHEVDVEHEADAEAEVERAFDAYANLTSARKELSASVAKSQESMTAARAAKKALKDYKASEKEKTRRARDH